MAITKGTGTSLLSAVTTTQTTAAQDVSGNYLTEVYCSIVQVGTATTAASIQIQVSPDVGTTYYSPPVLLWTAGLAAGTYNTVLPVVTSANKMKVTFTAQSGGTSSTATVQLNPVTAV